ncbi:hypothetical protein B296_00030657, partial [Ensete ventricosum]
VRMMWWELAESSLGVRRRDQEARWDTPGDNRKKTIRLDGRLPKVAGLPRIRSIVELDGLVWL